MYLSIKYVHIQHGRPLNVCAHYIQVRVMYDDVQHLAETPIEFFVAIIQQLIIIYTFVLFPDYDI